MSKQIYIDYSSKIEDHKDATFVDFANKYIGGGILGTGATQEEILFLIHPESFSATLFFEVMEKNEAIYLGNLKRISNYSGYSYDL